MKDLFIISASLRKSIFSSKLLPSFRVLTATATLKMVKVKKYIANLFSKLPTVYLHHTIPHHKPYQRLPPPTSCWWQHCSSQSPTRLGPRWREGPPAPAPSSSSPWPSSSDGTASGSSTTKMLPPSSGSRTHLWRLEQLHTVTILLTFVTINHKVTIPGTDYPNKWPNCWVFHTSNHHPEVFFRHMSPNVFYPPQASDYHCSTKICYNEMAMIINCCYHSTWYNLVYRHQFCMVGAYLSHSSCTIG